MRRWLSVVSVVIVLSVGLATSAPAKNPGPAGLPAVQATVKDQCTGLPLAGVAASLVDAAGTAMAPSKTTTSGFIFDAGPTQPDWVLHVSAPGHVPLGGAADPGVPIGKNPGPVGRNPGPAGVPAVQRNPGPNGLPDGVQLFRGLRLAVLLAPSAGCPTPLRHARITALAGKVVDRDTSALIPGLTVGVIPDPASSTARNPGPVGVGNGTFKVPTLECGAYNLTVAAAGYDGLGPGVVWEDHGALDADCSGVLVSGDVAFGANYSIALIANGANQPPVIDWTTSSAYGTHVGNAVHLNAAAHDPDPADNPLLSHQWSSSSPSCTFTAPTNLATDVACGAGNALLTLTVTDPHAAAATSSFVLLVLPGAQS